MKTFHRILAAVDFTEPCRRALKEAARRASIDHAEVVAVHVMDDFLMEELKRALNASDAKIREEWNAKLKAFVDESDAGGATMKTEVWVGNPLSELSEACRVHEADLLVMGAKGSRDEPGRIGVIAAKCVRKAPVDVLLVRSGAQGPFKKVVACVDFSENSAKAVQEALHVAKTDGASLDCLYVYQSALAMSLDYGGMVPPVPAGAEAESLQAWKDELVKFIEPLTRDAGDVKVTTHVIERVNIRESILAHVAETGAELVVLGTRGKTGLREFLIGTTAEKIIQNAPCAILAVKPDDVVMGAD